MRELVFLTGCGRSGTTILGEALGRHPDVRFLNDRFDLWIHDLPMTDVWGLNPQDAGRTGAKIAMCFSDLDDPAVRSGVERIRERLERERGGARVLIEKTAINNFRLGFLHRAFPEASFINITREGEATAASIARKIESGVWYGDDDRKWRLLVELASQRGDQLGEVARRCATPFEKGLLEWKLSVEAGGAFFRDHPKARAARVRYESLLQDPGCEIARLLEFLGLSKGDRPAREVIEWSCCNITPQPTSSRSPRREPDPSVRDQPAFIVGVPRSGTTLLRVLLDSHSAIACGPETPWLCAHGGPSLQGLVEHLLTDRLGYCLSFGMDEATLLRGARLMVESLLGEYAQSRGKRRWVEKTPGHGPRLPFLRRLFPDARYIVIDRDGTSVAASTAVVDERRRGISESHERWLDLARDPDGKGDGLVRVEATPFAAAVRWRYWSGLIERSLSGAHVHRVSYAHLLREPDAALRRVCEFLGEDFEPAMIDYGEHPHDLPEWEWGTADVRIGRIDPSRADRRSDIDEPELSLVRGITEPTIESDGSPVARLASRRELESAPFRLFMARVNELARALRLQEHTTWSKIWEYPFLWLALVSRVDVSRARVVDIGSERSPMPWLMAMLGAQVTLVETNREYEQHWRRLRRILGVELDWHFVESAGLPMESNSADLVTSYSVIEHQTDRRRAIDEAARVLRPGGTLAISFDVCEPELGMAFPTWNGRAMTLAEFEREVWDHPAFGALLAPGWNREDIATFLEWHRSTAPHHNYAVGAAVLVKQ